MAKVNFVKKARKDYPEEDIKKGESYYWWSFRFGGKHYSKTPPKPSQLTGSPFLSSVLSAQEQLADLNAEDKETLESTVEEIVGELESLKDETQSSFDNMPEGLQQGDTGQLLEGRVTSLEEMIDEIQGVDLEDPESAVEELSNINYNGE